MSTAWSLEEREFDGSSINKAKISVDTMGADVGLRDMKKGLFPPFEDPHRHMMCHGRPEPFPAKVGMGTHCRYLGIAIKYQALPRHGDESSSLKVTVVPTHLDGPGSERPRSCDRDEIEHQRNVIGCEP